MKTILDHPHFPYHTLLKIQVLLNHIQGPGLNIGIYGGAAYDILKKRILLPSPFYGILSNDFLLRKPDTNYKFLFQSFNFCEATSSPSPFLI